MSNTKNESALERDDRATKAAMAATDKLQERKDKAYARYIAYCRLYNARYDDAYTNEYYTERS